MENEFDKEKSERFRTELLALMRKYGVRLEDWEHYDGNEEKCGDSYVFLGDGIQVDLSEILE